MGPPIVRSLSTMSRYDSTLNGKTKMTPSTSNNELAGMDQSVGDALCLGPREVRVFAGQLDNLPPLHSKIVRIFTSSTFTDTQVERNMLMEQSYPRLKEFCREKHGLEFQVVDMRWGVPDEALDDHMTVEVCLNEIRNCQKMSIGPNFMLLLGMKYGYRPVPRQIDVEEFEKLAEVITRRKGNMSLLNTWYKKDTNAEPPVYVLLPISTHLIYFNKKYTRSLCARDQDSWWETLGRLQLVLRDAATELYHDGGLTPHQYQNYFISVTEREVTSGILNAEEPSKHCLVYVRNIIDIAEASPDTMRNFIDVSYNKINPEPQALQHRLREKLEQLKSVEWTDVNYKKYDLPWAGEEGIDPVDTHKDYIDEFRKHFETNMIRLIDEAMADQKKRELDKSLAPVYDEVLQQLHACQQHCRVFQGQENILTLIAEYLQDRSDVPLVLYGQSGCGKTSIMAKAYSQVIPASAVMVIRFLGTSPNSSLIISLLRNICQQIAMNYDYHSDKDIPTEMSLLVQHFNKMLGLATEEKRLIVFLDSVDQLSTAYEARLLQWIPNTLPPNVKLVLSTLPTCESDNILQTIERKIPVPGNIIQVAKLGEQLSKDILSAWLQDAGRKVTFDQQGEIDRVVQCCSLPLFLRLVFDQICRWKSFELEIAGDIVLATTISESINVLFERLEVSYGKLFVSKCFGYLTTSRDGLTETELDDILSLDDELLNAVHQYHKSPVRRVPPLLWTRLRSEIPNYLTEREADGVNVINWYHRQFFEVVKTKYLHNMNMRLRFHSQLADYFLGIWGGKPKPFQYTEEQRKMFSLKPDEINSSADRLVPKQPLVFMNNGRITSYNLRKLSQLPFHLINAERFVDVETYVLLDFNWLHAKLSAMPLQTVLADFIDTLEVSFNTDIKILFDSLRLAGSSLTQNPDMLGTQIVGRLIPYYHSRSKIRYVIDKCDTDGTLRNALVPAHHCLHTPGGPLMYSLVGHPGAPFGIEVTSDKRYLVSISRICIIWDISIGDVWRKIEPDIRGIMQGLSLSEDDKYAACYTNPDNQIVILYIVTGEDRIIKNPFQNSDKLRGLRCNKSGILVWSSNRWAILNIHGTVTLNGEFLHGWSSILDMIFTTNVSKPIVKLQRIDRQGGTQSSCVLRHMSNDAQDFPFSGAITFSKDFCMIYACSTHLATTNGIPDVKSRYVKRYVTSITEHVLEDKLWTVQQALGETQYTVYALTLSDDEIWLVASVEPGFVLWNVKDVNCKSDQVTLSLPEGKKNYPGSKSLCVFSRNNEYFMAGSRKALYVYDMKNKCLLKEIAAHFDRMFDIKTIITSTVNIAITSSGDKTIQIWNFDNIMNAVPVTDQHDKEIESISVSRDGTSAVCVLRDAVGLWDVSSGSLIRTLVVSNVEYMSYKRLPNRNASVEITKMTCAVITNSARFVIATDTEKMIFWEAGTGDVLHMHFFPTPKDGQHPKHTTQLSLTDNDKRVIATLRTKPDFRRPKEPLLGLCICIKIPSWEVIFEAEFQTKIECNSVLTNNSLYLTMPIHVGKAQCPRLGVWHLNTGLFLYDLDIDKLKSSEILDLVPLKGEASQVVVVDKHKASIVEINRNLRKKINDNLVCSFPGWNGHATSDGQFGVRRSSTEASLQLFSLHTGKTVRTLFTGLHAGDIQGSIFLTSNDKHAVYYQQRHGIIKILRLFADDGDARNEVAVCQPDARVCGLVDVSDGKELVMGLSNGKILVYVIADPQLKDNVSKLKERHQFSKYDKSSNGNTSSLARARWTGAINVSRIAAKANTMTLSESKMCVIQ